MCLILFGWQTRPDLPLVIAANRDEIRTRPTRALHRWPDLPIIAGRDELAGGTWMGVNPERPQRVAAVTNVRTGVPDRSSSASDVDKRSRGTLPIDFLVGDRSPADFSATLVTDAARYDPVNLLVADADELWWATTWPRPTAVRVSPGVHGLSNGTLDSRWPKVVDGCAAFDAVLDADRIGAEPDPYFGVLADRNRAPDEALPNTGVPIDFERALSPIFVDIPATQMLTARNDTAPDDAPLNDTVPGDYGTRAGTVLRIRADGHGDLHERRFASGARLLGGTDIDF